MRIVQSFWTKPVFQNSNSLHTDRAKGGWIDQASHFMAWALSCLQLRLFYKEVVLVTDQLGKSILIDLLNLPYTQVYLTLESLNDCNPDLWALGKITAYQLQEKPFIHVDGDVFIFESFPKHLTKASLVCQNLDIDHEEYNRMLTQMEQNNLFMPKAMAHDYRHSKNTVACNAGIFGGTDHDFFQRYCQTAFDMVNRNQESFDQIHVPTFNIIYEQYLFQCMAREAGINIEPYFDTPDVGLEPRKLVAFHKSPVQHKYIHMISGYKQNAKLVTHMRDTFRMMHPEYYYKVTHKLKKEGLL